MTISPLRALGAAATLRLLLAAPAQAQHDTVAVAGPEYRRGAVYRLFFGREYRDLWTAPLQATVLDLRSFAGGLTPTTAGGGFQTKSLRFRGADGYQYSFRSVDKNPGVLPSEIDSTFIKDIVKDQISSQHPGAPAVVAPLLEAAGIIHTDPVLVMLPDDPALGRFRQDFAGTLGFLERRAIVEPGRPGFAGALEIINSRNLFPRLRRSPADRINQRALLAARLVDGFLGDWDRHRDQWTWARFSDQSPVLWTPIPEDRDQAFSRFDGFMLGIARATAAPFLLNFGEAYPAIVGQTWNGRDVDRWFLGELDRATWDSVATALAARLTDSVIDGAVRRLAPAWYALDGERLARTLRRRRDALPRMAESYYRYLAREAEVHATAADEDVTVDRLADGRLAVQVSVRGSEPYFARTYDADVTREVRVFTRGGADRVVLRGEGPAAITVRVVADSSAVVLDSSRAGAWRRYDAAWTPLLRRREPRFGRMPQRPGVELEEPAPARDWGARLQPLSWLSFGPDVGVFLGGGATRTAYGFRKTPFASRWQLRGGWATGASEGRVGLDGTIRRAESRVHAQVAAYASGIEVLRWNGPGNATTLTRPNNYYRVNQAQLSLETRLVVPLGAHFELGAGPGVRYTHTRAQPGRIMADSTPYGSGNFGQVGLRAALAFDSRDNPSAPTRGATLALGGSAYPAQWSVDSAFAEVHAQATAYASARGAPLRPTLALRGGARRVFGAYPYFDAAFIGDAASVRLGRQNRYGGDAAVWGNAELRLALTRFFVILPGQLGAFGLGDVGRVFLKGESSDRWHTAVGGGVWIAVAGSANVVSAAVAKSSERTALYLGAGFAY